jgi:hypothetical protein
VPVLPEAQPRVVQLLAGPDRAAPPEARQRAKTSSAT